MMQYKFVGIDVSKYKLDVCILNELNKHIEKTFDNTKEGLNLLTAGLKKQPAFSLTFVAELSNSSANA